MPTLTLPNAFSRLRSDRTEIKVERFIYLGISSYSCINNKLTASRRKKETGEINVDGLQD